MKKYEQPDFSIHNTLYSLCLLLCIVSTFYASQFWRKMFWKLSVYTIHPPTVHVGITFQPSRPHSSWEKCDKNILIKGQICSSSLIPIYMIYPPLSSCAPSFNLLGLTVPEKSVTKIFNVWTLEKEKIKGQISSSSLILVYMIHSPTVHMCTKSQPSRPHSSR